MHVCGDVSYRIYRATYFIYVVMLVSLSIGLQLHVCGDVSYSM